MSLRIQKQLKEEILPLLKNMWRVAKMSWRIDRKNISLYCIFMVTQVVTSIAAIYFAGQVFNELFKVLLTHSSPTRLYEVFFIGAILLTIEQVAWRLMSYFQNSSYIIWQTVVAPEFSRKLIDLDIPYYEDSTFSKLLNKVAEGYDWKPANFMYNGLNTVHGFLRMVGTAVALVAFSPLILLILVIIIIPSLIVEMRQSKIKYGVWSEKGDKSRRYYRITGMMRDKQNVMDIRVFGLVDYLVDFLHRMLEDFNTEQQKALKRFIRPAVLVRMVEGIAIGLINFWLIVRVIRGVFTVGQYTFYSGMVNQFNSSLGIVLSSLGILYDSNLYMTDYFDFMGTEPLLPVSTNPTPLPAGIPEIRFENVSFKYPQGDRYIFKHLSLTIKAGESIALVGENGAGKSTLIKLLLRLYDATEGTIYINGVDIRDIDINTWYKQVSALMQDFSRYPFPIENNIHFGRIQKPLDKELLGKSTKLGGVDTFVDELPKGLKTMLDPSFDDGVEPSGGQWQRVALARAFYRNANVLILDEPTAAIDANAEYEIFKNITSSQKDKTTIIVSHRFSTVRTADHIYVLQNGTIREHGTHEGLMKHDSTYASMFNKQAEGYK